MSYNTNPQFEPTATTALVPADGLTTAPPTTSTTLQPAAGAAQRTGMESQVENMRIIGAGVGEQGWGVGWGVRPRTNWVGGASGAQPEASCSSLELGLLHTSPGPAPAPLAAGPSAVPAENMSPPELVATSVCDVCIPPLGTAMATGSGGETLINLLLFLCGYLPGMVHALAVTYSPFRFTARKARGALQQGGTAGGTAGGTVGGTAAGTAGGAPPSGGVYGGAGGQQLMAPTTTTTSTTTYLMPAAGAPAGKTAL